MLWPRPSRRSLLFIALAFAVGLALFLLLWIDQRNDDQFFRAGGGPTPDAQGPAFEPLPTPEAVGGRDGGRSTEADNGGASAPETAHEAVVEEAPRPEPLPPPPSAPDAGASAGPDASAKPIRSPQPRYPAQAMRRGESGTVLLQVQVDAQGRPSRVDVVQSSRSRTLDREAQRAVEQWLFSPAIRNGRVVPSNVLVPIEFRP
jgi:protein TonB